MARGLRLRFTERADQLPSHSAGALELLRVNEGPFPWASIETYPDAMPEDQTTAAASFMASEIDDTGVANEPYGALMLVAFDVPPARVKEVEAWYVEEHVPLLMRAPGWLRARRYLVSSASGPIRWTHLAFHELRDFSVLATKERAFARSTPWRAKFSAEPWFESAGRVMFEPAS